MAVTTGRTALSAVTLTVILGGCFHNPPKPEEELKSWFDVQRKYAIVLDEQFGKHEKYRVVPAIGPIYRVGSVLRPKTSSLITDKCVVEQSLPKQEMGQLPLVKASKTFGLNLDLPSQIQDVLNNVAKLGIKADDIKTMELNYTNLIHEILSEENLDIALRKPKCRKAIENQNVIVIRGYIKGKLKAISDDSLEIDPKIKFVEMGEFNVKYKDKGGFSIEDLQSRPRFIIVTETRAETTLSTLTETKSDKSKIFTTSGKHKESKKEVKKETKEDAKPAGKVKEEFSIQYSRPKDESIEALFSGKPNRSP